MTTETTDKAFDLIRALSHPHRVHALHVLNLRTASPSELAKELGEDSSLVAYHVRELAKAGFIELVDKRQVRGATEHFYRATERAFFSEEEWLQVPPAMQRAIVAMQLRETGKLLSESVNDGTFERRGDRHHSLHEGAVDEQGWQETMAILEDAMHRIMEAQAQARERLAATDAPRVPLVVSLIGFEKSTAKAPSTM